MEIVLAIVGLFIYALLFILFVVLLMLASATIYALIKPHIAGVVNRWFEWFDKRTDI